MEIKPYISSKKHCITIHPASYSTREVLNCAIPPKIVELDGTKMLSKTSLFSEVAAKLLFPDYFGNNWDAFYDCISDLSWLPSHSYLIIWHNSSTLLLESAYEFYLFLEVFSSAAEFWETQNIHFEMVIADDFLWKLSDFIMQIHQIS